MQRAGYRTTLHIYLIFLFSLLGTILAAAVLFFLLITVRGPDGAAMRTDRPQALTEEFQQQLLFIDGQPRVSQAGVELLRDYRIGLQVLDRTGREVLCYRKPESAPAAYSDAALLQLSQTGRLTEDDGTAFVGTASHEGTEYTYLLYFPLSIAKVTMYLNGARFTGGKALLLALAAVLFCAVLLSGAVYGFWTAGTIKRLTASVQEIAFRRYLAQPPTGAFRELTESLNALDAEIRASDRARTQTERTREEWIANITHDLKTPLSPIKGYAELMREDRATPEQIRRYAAVTLKSAAYMEALIDDLKLTYQLQNDMLPVDRQERDIVRFLKELAIDILNDPAYEGRVIRFSSDAERLMVPFDQTLLTRAFRNLIINAFVHGTADTEVELHVAASRITVADNGPGMNEAETERLFDRYYRGADTGQKPEGTGLGLAISKSIIELHGGVLAVSSVPGAGTIFQIDFPLVKVN